MHAQYFDFFLGGVKATQLNIEEKNTRKKVNQTAYLSIPFALVTFVFPVEEPQVSNDEKKMKYFLRVVYMASKESRIH